MWQYFKRNKLILYCQIFRYLYLYWRRYMYYIHITPDVIPFEVNINNKIIFGPLFCPNTAKNKLWHSSTDVLPQTSYPLLHAFNKREDWYRRTHYHIHMQLYIHSRISALLNLLKRLGWRRPCRALELTWLWSGVWPELDSSKYNELDENLFYIDWCNRSYFLRDLNWFTKLTVKCNFIS